MQLISVLFEEQRTVLIASYYAPAMLSFLLL